MNAAAGSEPVAVLRCARRVWAIGPMHGMRAKLVALHEFLWERFEAGDRLVYLGNYMGLGPDVIGTIDELVSFRTAVLCRAGVEPEDIVFLRGAQEEMWRKLLQIQFAPAPLDVFEWMMSRGVDATLAAYGGERAEGAGRCRGGPLAITRWTNALRDAMRRHPGHEDVMVSLRQAAMTEGGELLFTHAGIDPTRPLHAQGDVFWWGSSRFANLQEPYEGFRTVVAGFRADHPGIVVTPHAAVVDAGCGFGGKLAAGCFDLEGRMVDRIEV